MKCSSTEFEKPSPRTSSSMLLQCLAAASKHATAGSAEIAAVCAGFGIPHSGAVGYPHELRHSASSTSAVVWITASLRATLLIRRESKGRARPARWLDESEP